MIDFVSGDTCHTRSLIALFGTEKKSLERQSDWSCGHCTFCERGAKSIQLFPAEYPAGFVNEASFPIHTHPHLFSLLKPLFLVVGRLRLRQDAWESFVQQAHQQGWSNSSDTDARFRLKTGQFDHRVFAHMLVGLQTRGVRRLKLQKNPCFGSMANNDLATLYTKCQDFFQGKEQRTEG